MAEKHSATPRRTHRPPTGAERRKAIAFLRKQGGRHLARPINTLVGDTPADTMERCKRVISWFAHIDEPFHSEALEAAKADILHGVVDAMAHAETVLRQVGSNEDPDPAERARRAEQRLKAFVRPKVLREA